MALVKASLKAELVVLFNALKSMEDQTSAIDKMAGDMATAIDTYIKSGSVTVASGITLTTTGTASAQSGATTGTGTGTIS